MLSLRDATQTLRCQCSLVEYIEISPDLLTDLESRELNMHHTFAFGIYFFLRYKNLPEAQQILAENEKALRGE
jgi:hypothetical protein